MSDDYDTERDQMKRAAPWITAGVVLLFAAMIATLWQIWLAALLGAAAIGAGVISYWIGNLPVKRP